MQPFEENSVSNRPAVRFSPPSARLAAAVLAMVACLAVFLGLGHNWGYPEERPRSSLPGFRYVDSGWISPVNWRELGPLARELRAFIIVSQDELDEFESGFVSKVSRGNPTSLGRIDFDTSVLLAAYYAWLPVRGDPFSVAGVLINDNEALVSLALEEDPQGREYPYLYASMTMVAMERSLFPQGEPVEFIFALAGHEPVSRTAIPN